VRRQKFASHSRTDAVEPRPVTYPALVAVPAPAHTHQIPRAIGPPPLLAPARELLCDSGLLFRSLTRGIFHPANRREFNRNERTKAMARKGDGFLRSFGSSNDEKRSQRRGVLGPSCRRS
jgi:hypothetical protein